MDAFRANLEIRTTTSKGQGVFTKVFIPAKTIVFEVKGSVVDRADLSKYNDTDNFFQVGQDTFLSKSGDLDYYINHGCNPNCGLRITGNRALIISLYDIQPNIELTWDYSTTSTDSQAEWSMNCSCDDYKCRKVVSGFSTLTKEQQLYYINLGVVPKYLIK